MKLGVKIVWGGGKDSFGVVKVIKLECSLNNIN